SSGKLRNDVGRPRPYERECPRGGGDVLEGDVIHDDELFQRGECTFARDGLRNRQDAVRQRVSFNFSDDVSLRRQQQPYCALPRLEVSDIRSQYRIQVTVPVGPRKREESLEIGV